MIPIYDASPPPPPPQPLLQGGIKKDLKKVTFGSQTLEDNAQVLQAEEVGSTGRHCLQELMPHAAQVMHHWFQCCSLLPDWSKTAFVINTALGAGPCEKTYVTSQKQPSMNLLVLEKKHTLHHKNSHQWICWYLRKKHTLHHKNSHQWICWYLRKNIRYITKTAINESAGTWEKTYVTSQKQPSMNLLVLEKKHTLHHKNSHQWICWYLRKNIRYITKTAINESAGTWEKTYVTSQKQPSMNLLVLEKKHTLHHKNSHQWICWYLRKNIRYITKTAINESAGTWEKTYVTSQKQPSMNLLVLEKKHTLHHKNSHQWICWYLRKNIRYITKTAINESAGTWEKTYVTSQKQPSMNLLVLEKKHTLHHKNSHQWICWYLWKNIRYITKTAINESAGTWEKTYVTSQKQPSMNLLVLEKKHTLHHKNSHQWICWYLWKNIRYITKIAINESAGTGEC